MNVTTKRNIAVQIQYMLMSPIAMLDVQNKKKKSKMENVFWHMHMYTHKHTNQINTKKITEMS